MLREIRAKCDCHSIRGNGFVHSPDGGEQRTQIAVRVRLSRTKHGHLLECGDRLFKLTRFIEHRAQIRICEREIRFYRDSPAK